MTENQKTITTAQYSEKTGISVSTAARMLRQGKLPGKKVGGKWAIFESELQDHGSQPQKTSEQAAASPGISENAQPVKGKTYDVESFARLTYLTENGVRRWLKMGRLSGSSGQVDASNLQRPEFKHLVR